MSKMLNFMLLTSIVALLTGCAAAPIPTAANSAAPADAAESNGKLNVVTTVSPITNLIYNIGGEHINLTGIVPEGTNSHTFEPAPSDAVKLATADLIFINGLHLEQPTLSMAEANKNDNAEVILLGEQTIEPEQYVYDFSFPQADGNPNPHLWLNPMYALRYAEIIRDALSNRDPDNAESYGANYEALAERIQALDEAITDAIATIPEANRRLLTYHDSWAYFAPRYGLSVIGAIQPSDFAEPSAREVADLITQIRDEQVPAVFGSEVFPSPVLEQIARETGVTYVDQLRDDDLPGQPGEPQHSYIGMMVSDVQIMVEALGGDATQIAQFDTTNIPGADQEVVQPQ